MSHKISQMLKEEDKFGIKNFKTLSDKSAEEIKDGLVEMCDNWLDDTAELQDDMTFVIIKKR